MFAGRYKSSMDKKGRVVIPRAFRQVTPDTVWTRAVLTSGLDSCLFLYKFSAWEDLIGAKALQTSGLPDVELMLFQRLFAGSGHVVEVDQFNRIVVPQELRDEAALEDDCVWVGAVSRAELWSARNWDAYRSENRGKLREIWDRISRRGQVSRASTDAGAAQGTEGE